LPDALHELYVQPKVGHYGVFNGRRFNDEIYPRIRSFIERAEAAVVTA
jgi:poly(3-hydroxybutyrate) depolymerase